ncbi:helix-turn-helix domain-containing protein [Halosquirtibacter xylanolyticus]|uniref:two-component regulator propeller domain-containing protein n=1 Tax=Halosquirtibacter xylanolyticus TaxID=3374599 RepID=UPI003747E9E7|nr:helix-turn-helix domain-containing protein [Prolixibacteraceae bacterium]
MKEFYIVTLLLLIWSVKGLPQPLFRHYTIENGLSHNEVRVIKRGKDGMMWFGSQNGLSSFDGYRFRIYKQGGENTICGDKIFSLTPSSNGNIWVGTTTGLCELNPVTGKATAFQDTFAIKTHLDNSIITSLLEDQNGYLWIGTIKGNYRYFKSNHTIEKVLEGKTIYSFNETKEGFLWICHNGGVDLLNSNDYRHIKHFSANIQRVYQDRYGLLWGIGGHGLYRFHSDRGVFEHINEVRHPLRKGFNSIAEDRNGNLFMGNYGGGLTIYAPKEGRSEYLFSRPSLQTSISSNDLYDIFTDEMGVVWIGTQEGLDYYDWSRQRFIKWEYNPDNPYGLDNSFIRSIFRDKKGCLWLGTRDRGLEQMDLNSSITAPTFTHLGIEAKKRGFSGHHIAEIMEDSKGRLWVATLDGGLNLLKPNQSKWKSFIHQSGSKQSIPSSATTSIIEDRTGRILLGTYRGLSILTQDDQGEFQFTNYASEEGKKHSLSGNSIFKVFQDHNGRIWIATNGSGLNLMHEEMDGRIWFEHFRHHPDDRTSLSNNEVFVIFEDSEVNLWIGTSGAGFNKVVESQDDNHITHYTFRSYTEKDGLPDNEVNGILEDDDGNLWISTNSGVSRFDPKTETFSNYSDYDGVLSGKFRKNSAWKDPDGKMFFGGTAGVNIFDPKDFPMQRTLNTPKITSLTIDDLHYRQGDTLNHCVVWGKNKNQQWFVTLPKTHNRFKIQISSMSFASCNRNKYAWRMPEVDTTWNYYQGNDPTISYANLSAGKYTLEIRCVDQDRYSDTLKLTVTITSHIFGAYVWFWMLGLLLLLAFILNLKKQKRNTPKDIVISPEEEELIVHLKKCMTDKELYLDVKLTLSDLAKEINVTPNQLSHLLNEVVGRAFYDFVNDYRIEEVKKRLVDPIYHHHTIISIAWDCGFNSKSAFNRIFKTNTGMTPSAFRRKYSVL